MLTRLINLLLAITQYIGDEQYCRRTEVVLDRLGDRVHPMARLYHDAWGDTARTGHSVSERLAEHLLPRLTHMEPWEIMRLGVAAYYVDGLGALRIPRTTSSWKTSRWGHRTLMGTARRGYSIVSTMRKRASPLIILS
jgi:hypothetical protein